MQGVRSLLLLVALRSPWMPRRHSCRRKVGQAPGLSVFRGTFDAAGSAAFDFYGANRIGGDLYANCLLALKPDTGERVWHFKALRHDLWDRALPAPPALVEVVRHGKRVDAVAHQVGACVSIRAGDGAAVVSGPPGHQIR